MSAYHVYRVNFHRYINGQSRISTDQFVTAQTLTDAVAITDQMLKAMRGVDPKAHFTVARVEQTGLQGEPCHGASMFETGEEMVDRLCNDAAAKLA